MHLRIGKHHTACGLYLSRRSDQFSANPYRTTCTDCLATDEYKAARTERNLMPRLLRTASPEEHGVLDYDSLKKAPTT